MKVAKESHNVKFVSEDITWTRTACARNAVEDALTARMHIHVWNVPGTWNYLQDSASAQQAHTNSTMCVKIATQNVKLVADPCRTTVYHVTQFYIDNYLQTNVYVIKIT